MRHIRGFTLVELMIVISIIALLATIAYPSYVNQVTTAKRAEAAGAMLELVQFMERHYTESGMSYLDGEAAPALPFDWTDETSKRYSFGLTNVTSQTFTLTATLKSSSDDSDCGNLIIDQTGAQSVSVEGADPTECWQ